MPSARRDSSNHRDIRDGASRSRESPVRCRRCPAIARSGAVSLGLGGLAPSAAKIVEIIEHKVGVIAGLGDDRKALEEIREHCQRMLKILQGKTGGWFDVSEISQTCDQKIEIVQAGLNKL